MILRFVTCLPSWSQQCSSTAWWEMLLWLSTILKFEADLPPPHKHDGGHWLAVCPCRAYGHCFARAMPWPLPGTMSKHRAVHVSIDSMLTNTIFIVVSVRSIHNYKLQMLRGLPAAGRSARPAHGLPCRGKAWHPRQAMPCHAIHGAASMASHGRAWEAMGYQGLPLFAQCNC